MIDRQAWQVRSKIWLEVGGRPVIGEGRLLILRAIGEHGSIKKAAEKTGISYRRIWGAIRDMEQHAGRAIVVTERGGIGKGGASLTVFARRLMERFERLVRGLNQEVDTRFAALLEIFFSACDLQNPPIGEVAEDETL